MSTPAETPAPETPETPETPAPETPEVPETPDPDLGDAGKKALSEERAARKAAEKKAAEHEAEIARLRRSNAATKGVDLDAIKAEIRGEFGAQLLTAEIKAEAKGRLADPADALNYPQYTKDIKAGDDAAITAAIDQLLKDKPYLAAADSAKPWGDVGGGQRKDAAPEPATPMERMARAYGAGK
ncbi:hypothetical protein OHA79_09635 [Streptomyces sp. NBC_00841]|uniref:hypothetical protein n=1 Tax=Streptomyces sp. NBC_00841 TaxID=2975847 RepID=UPI002DD7FB5A|nr:hypothetical protein [Streptomyces sp. NBC_00841]WRZ98076.1 hypothetical protein OHA79_09635 [Streptomyces sp. NBC_00841]